MNEPAWVEHAIWWQVYPLGFVGAFPADPPPSTDEHRMRRIVDWFDHAVALGASGIALGPQYFPGHASELAQMFFEHRPVQALLAAKIVV